MQKEPALIIGGAASAVSILVAILLAFGVSVTPEQKQLIQEAMTVLLPLLVAALTRLHVYSPASVKAIQINAAAKAAEQSGAPKTVGELP